MKIITLIMSLMICTSLVMAQELVTPEDIVVAGTTPDSPFYGLEIAFEGFTEMFGENIKIQHAKERLAEAKVMIAENKPVQSRIAIQNFEKVRNRMRNQERIKEHKKLVDNLAQRISTITSNRELSEFERTQIRTLIQDHKPEIEQENIGIIAQNRNVNQEQAQQLFEQEQERLQNRVTTRIEQKTQNLNQNN